MKNTMEEPIANPPEELEEKLLTKKDKSIDTRSLNIEQELLAEIQVYRDKQKRFEESKLARMIRRVTVHVIFYLSFVWFMTTLVALFLPSILPSIHSELSAINTGFLFAGVLLGLYDTVMLRSEIKSIEKSSFDHFQAKVEEDKKGQVLLDQLKQNREMYQQKIDEELRESFSSLSMLMLAINSSVTSAIPENKPLGDSYVANFLYFVFLLLSYAALFYCQRKGDPDDKPIDWDSYRALWRNEITLEEFERRMNLSESGQHEPAGKEAVRNREAEKMLGDRKERMITPKKDPVPEDG